MSSGPLPLKLIAPDGDSRIIDFGMMDDDDAAWCLEHLEFDSITGLHTAMVNVKIHR